MENISLTRQVYFMCVACDIIFPRQVLDRAHFLPHIGSGAETRSQYQGLCQALDEYTRKTFYEWTQTVDKVWNVSLHYIFVACGVINFVGTRSTGIQWLISFLGADEVTRSATDVSEFGEAGYD